MANNGSLGAQATKVVLLVLFVPSADRNGKPLANQAKWKQKTLEQFGRTFGGATAMPPAEGVWRDDGRNGNLVFEQPILVHCYASNADLAVDRNLQALGKFCRAMLKDMDQGEIGLIIDNQYHAFN